MLTANKMNILNNNELHLQKPKLNNSLGQGDHDKCFEFSCDIYRMLENILLKVRTIVFSDEATLSSDGTVSTQSFS